MKLQKSKHPRATAVINAELDDRLSTLSGMLKWANGTTRGIDTSPALLQIAHLRRLVNELVERANGGLVGGGRR